MSSGVTRDDRKRAGAVALLPLAALARRPTSAPRLVAITAIAVIALVWLA